MSIVTGSNLPFALALCDALGIKDVQSANLGMAANEAVMLTVTVYVSKEALEQACRAQLEKG